MPKLLLSVSDLRSLAGYAIRALRHPVTTGEEAIATARAIVGGFVSHDAAPSTTPGTTPGTTSGTAAHPDIVKPAPPKPAKPAPPVTPDPAEAAEAAVERQAAPRTQAPPRRTGPAPHLSRMPRDVERDVELELEDDEALGSAGATFESTQPGREPEQPGADELGDPGVAKSVRKESSRAARASEPKKR